MEVIEWFSIMCLLIGIYFFISNKVMIAKYRMIGFIFYLFSAICMVIHALCNDLVSVYITNIIFVILDAYGITSNVKSWMKVGNVKRPRKNQGECE